MDRYFFHFSSKDELISDTKGRELSDLSLDPPTRDAADSQDGLAR
jgi:hypothetical protein